MRNVKHIYIFLFFSTFAFAEKIQFDTEILEARGLNKDLSHYFSEKPRFLPGMHAVVIDVNGQTKGTTAVNFNEEGSLCFNKDFYDFSGIIPVKFNYAEKCHDLLSDYPRAVVNTIPGQERIEIFLPQEAINHLNINSGALQHNGTAAVLNYSLFSTKNVSEGGGSSSYSQASLEGGLNAFEWLLRSRYILTDSDGRGSAESIYTYAEHAFTDYKLNMQIGEINTHSDVLSGVPITGVQLLPAGGMQNAGSGISISGIAHTAQARVEVRQNGQLIYNTLVPAGAFRLDDLQLIRNNVDLDVTVVETDGSINTFIVPAQSVVGLQLTRPEGLAVSIGQLRLDYDHEDPLLLNVTYGVQIHPVMNFFVSGLAAEDYQAAGFRTVFRLMKEWDASISTSASKAQFSENTSGIKNELETSYRFTDTAGLTAGVSHYTDDYRELADSVNESYKGYSDRLYTDVHWAHPTAGTFSFGFNHYQSAGDYPDSRHMIVSWSKILEYASLNIIWQRVLSSDNKANDTDLFYMNVSIPLGRGNNLSTYARNQDSRTLFGMALNGPLSQNSSYYISSDYDNNVNFNNINGSINSNMHYTQVSFGAGKTKNSDNYNTMASGEVAIHESGVTFSPYSINDTFAIAKLSEPEPGVEIFTPQGTIWTDAWGQAVIPGLTEWRNSRIEVNANKLPKNMTLANGIKFIAPAHASVSEVNFKILNNRRVMLHLKNTSGKALEKGLSIVDKEYNYVTTVVDDGILFLNNADETPTIYAVSEQNIRQCKLYFSFPEKNDDSVLYDEVNGICR